MGTALKYWPMRSTPTSILRLIFLKPYFGMSQLERNLERHLSTIIKIDVNVKSLKLTRSIHVSELEDLHQEIQSITKKIGGLTKS